MVLQLVLLLLLAYIMLAHIIPCFLLLPKVVVGIKWWWSDLSIVDAMPGREKLRFFVKASLTKSLYRSSGQDEWSVSYGSATAVGRHSKFTLETKELIHSAYD